MRAVSKMATRTGTQRGDAEKSHRLGTARGQRAACGERAMGRTPSTRGISPSASPAAHIGEERVTPCPNEQNHILGLAIFGCGGPRSRSLCNGLLTKAERARWGLRPGLGCWWDVSGCNSRVIRESKAWFCAVSLPACLSPVSGNNCASGPFRGTARLARGRHEAHRLGLRVCLRLGHPPSFQHHRCWTDSAPTHGQPAVSEAQARAHRWPLQASAGS